MITGPDNGLVTGRVSFVFTEGRLSAPLVEAPIARNLGLNDGQIVQATVQARGEQLGLLLRGRFLDIPPRQDWQAGQNLAFRVEVNPNGSLTLHPIPLVTPLPIAVAVAVPVELAPKPPVLTRVESLLFRPPGAPEMVSLFRPGVMDSLLVNLPRPDLMVQWKALQLSRADITPDAIRQALFGSMGTEASIFKGKMAFAKDPKQLFLSLVTVLSQGELKTESIPDSENHIQHAIDELESAQVHALQSQNQGEMMFSIVLPFKDADPVEISFERQTGSNQQNQLLTVNVHSQSSEFGELWLKTNLHGKTDVELVMWAAREGIAEQARQLSGLLGLELQSAGLVMRSFQAIHGERPSRPSDRLPTGSGHILDMRA